MTYQLPQPHVNRSWSSTWQQDSDSIAMYICLQDCLGYAFLSKKAGIGSVALLLPTRVQRASSPRAVLGRLD